LSGSHCVANGATASQASFAVALELRQLQRVLAARFEMGRACIVDENKARRVVTKMVVWKMKRQRGCFDLPESLVRMKSSTEMKWPSLFGVVEVAICVFSEVSSMSLKLGGGRGELLRGKSFAVLAIFWWGVCF
jgi:hypothetical protein